MKNVLSRLLNILTACFLISLFSLLLTLICKEGSFVQWIFGTVAMSGLIISVNLFIVHVVLFLVSKVFKVK